MFNERLKQLRKEKKLSQLELAKIFNLGRTTITQYETGDRNPDLGILQKMAEFFGVSTDYLLGSETNQTSSKLPPGMIPVGEVKKIPVVGIIRAGEPILACENIIDYEYASAEEVKNGDYFFLRVKGDSMINSRIHDHDLVLVRKQNYVDSGEIAVVLIENEEATLKKVYWVSSNKVILQPDNPKYQPMVLDKKKISIIGKVIEVRFKP